MNEKKVVPRVVRYHNSKEYERITQRTLSGSRVSTYPLRETLAKEREDNTYPLRETLAKVCEGRIYPLRETLAKEREKLGIKRNPLSKRIVYPY